MLLAANWPKSAKRSSKQALETEQPFNILFVDSSEIQWEKQVTQNLTKSFGSEHIITSSITYDLSSKDIDDQGKQMEITAEEAQLVVL
jgi:uncharacterized beta-barrel protein YwiB (DUF1934 family)